jgi:sec-independent protein translocase protein TatB
VFGVGLQELVLIAFVAMLVFGPDRLPDIAKQAGRMARQVRSFANSARDELRSELGPDYADLQLRDLDPRVLVRKHIMEAMQEEDAKESGRTTSRTSLRPLAEGEAPPYDLDAT